MSIKVGEIPAEEVGEAIRKAYHIYRYEIKLPLIIHFMMLAIPERSGALLMSYISAASTSGELYSFLGYAELIEYLSGVAWSKSTAQDHAVQRTYEFSDSIDENCKQEAFRRVGLIR